MASAEICALLAGPLAAVEVEERYGAALADDPSLPREPHFPEE